MTECPIFLKTSWSTNSFPFESRTGFLGFFDNFFCLGSGQRGASVWITSRLNESYSQPWRFFAPYYHWSPGFTSYHLYFVALSVWSIDQQDRRGRVGCLSTVKYALVCLSGRHGTSSRQSTWCGSQPKKKWERVKPCSDQRYWSPWSLVSLLSIFGASKASRSWDIFPKKSEPWMLKSVIRWSSEIYLSLGGEFLIKTWSSHPNYLLCLIRLIRKDQ